MIYVGTIWIDYGMSRSVEEIREIIVNAATIDMQVHGDLLQAIEMKAHFTHMAEAEYPIASYPGNVDGTAFHWNRHQFPTEDPCFEYDLGRRFGFGTNAWEANFITHPVLKYARLDTPLWDVHDNASSSDNEDSGDAQQLAPWIPDPGNPNFGSPSPG